MKPECTLTISSTAELLAVTPYLLGFHPTDSVVVIGTVGPHVSFAARHDLPPPGAAPDELAPLVAAQTVEAATILGYGPADRVNPAVNALAAGLSRGGVHIRDKLRITAGRWWMCDCTDESCCPSAGRPMPSPHHPVAAAAVFQGQVALPSRRELEAQVAPIEGEQRERMTAVTAGVCTKLGRFLATDDNPEAEVERAGRAAIHRAEETYAAGRSLTLEETARLGVLLANRMVLGYAIDRSGDEQWRTALWTEVTRRVEPFWVAGPATMLAYTAWRAGYGALARVAVDRALRHDPRHRMAGVLDRLLAAGIGHESVVDFASSATPSAGRWR
ncbi:DUF4192 domain-containing protein [Actinoplanes sp. URMC 104]|uniref:DUF4192 domain-containing protein n=1 Tax=Actinoplanes sp. URMC 104 TaxID=3423409 RepID=UPI003F1DB7FD